MYIVSLRATIKEKSQKIIEKRSLMKLKYYIRKYLIQKKIIKEEWKDEKDTRHIGKK